MAHDDRHGRLQRSSADPRRRPTDGFRARDRNRFTRVVREALGRLPDDMRTLVAGMQLQILDVPDPDAPVDPVDGVVLATMTLGRTPDQGVLRVHRRAVELRSASRLDLLAVTERALRHAVQDALGQPRDED